MTRITTFTPYVSSLARPLQFSLLPTHYIPPIHVSVSVNHYTSSAVSLMRCHMSFQYIIHFDINPQSIWDTNSTIGATALCNTRCRNTMSRTSSLLCALRLIYKVLWTTYWVLCATTNIGLCISVCVVCPSCTTATLVHATQVASIGSTLIMVSHDLTISLASFKTKISRCAACESPRSQITISYATELLGTPRPYNGRYAYMNEQYVAGGCIGLP